MGPTPRRNDAPEVLRRFVGKWVPDPPGLVYDPDSLSLMEDPMKAKLLCTLVIVSVTALACGKDKAAEGTAGSKTEPAAAEKPAAEKPVADVSCDAVVAKLAGFNPGSGEPEKKLWTKMCNEMPQGVRACVVAASTLEASQKCMADKKLE